MPGGVNPDSTLSHEEAVELPQAGKLAGGGIGLLPGFDIAGKILPDVAAISFGQWFPQPHPEALQQFRILLNGAFRQAALNAKMGKESFGPRGAHHEARSWGRKRAPACGWGTSRTRALSSWRTFWPQVGQRCADLRSA